MLAFPVKCNTLLRDLFFFWFSALFEESVVETFFHRQAEVGIEHKDFVQEVDGFFAGSWVNCREVHSLAIGERVQVLYCLLVSHEALVFLTGGTDYLEDNSELVIL